MQNTKFPMTSLYLNPSMYLYSEKPFTSTEDAVHLIGEQLVQCTREMYCVICLDGAYRPICVSVLEMGKTSTVPIPIREILQTALLTDSTNIILLHNHPNVSKNLSLASKDDAKVVHLLMKVCDVVGINIHDSFVVTTQMGQNGQREAVSYSMKKHHILKFRDQSMKSDFKKTLAKNSMFSECISDEKRLPWEMQNFSSRDWGYDVSKDKAIDCTTHTAYTPEQLQEIMDEIKEEKEEIEEEER